jgi:hypothetical protein
LSIQRGTIHTPDASGGGGGGASGTIGNPFPATAAPLAGKDPSNNLKELHTAADGTLLVSVSGAGSGGTSSTDGAAYSEGTSAGTPLMGAMNDTEGGAVTEDHIAIPRITPHRALHTNLRRQDGTEVGTAAAPLQVSLANAPAVAVTPQMAGTSALSNVASSATSVTALAANAARLGATLYNDSNQNAYVKFGVTASPTSFVKVMLPQEFLDITPFKYTGRIDVIWVSANGFMRVTELTA